MTCLQVRAWPLGVRHSVGYGAGGGSDNFLVGDAARTHGRGLRGPCKPVWEGAFSSPPPGLSFWQLCFVLGVEGWRDTWIFQCENVFR
jgi:hypothetical protein